MERRGISRFGIAFALTLLTSLAMLVESTASSATALASRPATVVPFDPVPDAPPVTASEFFPDEENLSDCLGLVERPGCGSDARGGWRQTAVFGFIVIGLGVIVWRISRGVKANRAAQSRTPPAPPQ